MLGQGRIQDPSEINYFPKGCMVSEMGWNMKKELEDIEVCSLRNKCKG